MALVISIELAQNYLQPKNNTQQQQKLQWVLSGREWEELKTQPKVSAVWEEQRKHTCHRWVFYWCASESGSFEWEF